MVVQSKARSRPRAARSLLIGAVRDVLEHWELTPAGAEPIWKLERLFRDHLGGGHPLAVSSATVGLEVALRTVGVAPGDEVVMSAYDWGAAAGAVVRCGALPVFADIAAATPTLDPESLASRISPRTRAVVVTHYGGCPAYLDAVTELAQRHNLSVIEDCAQALGARYGGRPVGSFGDAAVFSFGWGKLLSAGEGGLVAFRDAALWRRAVGLCQHPLRQVREGATGQGDLAMNARIHPLAAALVLAQWELWPQWLERRRTVCLRLAQALLGVQGVLVPGDPVYGVHSFHRFLIVLPDEVAAQRVAEGMRERGFPVLGSLVREPLHLRAPFRDRYSPGDCPQAEHWCRAALCIEADWTRVPWSWTRRLAAALRGELADVVGASHVGAGGGTRG
ncbi:MAG: DegT/DnrJ/EryC1/StrS family aminotransferase [Bryobacteraceae bacterium]